MNALRPAMWRWLALLGAALVVAVGLYSAAFTASPGEDVLVERAGRITAGPLGPGLHWRIPLLEGVVRLGAGVRLDKGNVRTGSGTDVLGARYAVLWRIADARRYYTATGGDPGVVADRLDTALGPVLRKMLDTDKPSAFLARPAETVDAALSAAVKPPASKLGIDVLTVGLEEAEVPKSVQKKIGERMAASVSANAAASSGVAAEVAAAGEERARAGEIVAAAQRTAAGIRGHSEARVAEIYAKAAVQAPDFFRFYRELISEEKAMSSHTRALVISTDSPWFKLLRSDGRGGKTERKH